MRYLTCCCFENFLPRYVSQNVSYTSAIILKRAVKAKLDLGILLMCCIYMPVLFNLVQAVTCKSVTNALPHWPQ